MTSPLTTKEDDQAAGREAAAQASPKARCPHRAWVPE